jgi:hypothetical protein
MTQPKARKTELTGKTGKADHGEASGARVKTGKALRKTSAPKSGKEGYVSRDEQARADMDSIVDLLRSIPGGLSEWASHIGEPDPKKAGKRIHAALEAYLPGLFSVKPAAFQEPEAGEGSPPSACDGWRVTLNVGTDERMDGVAASISTHSPKLSNASARCRVPLDEREGTEGLDGLIGSHQIPVVECLDYFENAANMPLFRQLAHAFSNGGRYRLASPVMRHRLAPALWEQINRIERAVEKIGGTSWKFSPVYHGLPQLLIPDTLSSSGYIAVTPLASGAVLAEFDKQLRAFDAQQIGAPSEERARIKTAGWMSAVSKKQNMTGVAGAVRSVLAGNVPVSSREVREALSIRRDPVSWVARNARALRRYSETYKRNASAFQGLIGRMMLSESTNARDRHRLDGLADGLMFGVAYRWLSLASKRPELFEGSEWEIERFDVKRAAAALSAVPCEESDLAGHAVGPGLVDHWTQIAEAAVLRIKHSVEKSSDVAVGQS